VLGDAAPEQLTGQFARTVFGGSPVVVVGEPGKPDSTKSDIGAEAAARAARAAHAPLLLATAVTPQLTADVEGLHPRDVLDEGLPQARLRAALKGVQGIQVVGSAAQLPATAAPAALKTVAVLVPSTGTSTGAVASKSTSTATGPGPGAGEPGAGAIAAVTATAEAAGASVIPVTSGDPRTDPAAIEALARMRPGKVIALGKEFGPGVRLENRLAVAETGRQLPGGGQVMFPGRRLVALYGHPGTPGLGALGEQDLSATITRAEELADQYKSLSKVPVVPTFEIIATVAEGAPGPDGTYSAASTVAELRPWIDDASAHGMYVVLDLQPGRASLLAQAELYQSLLELPNVGLALDPEWKLQSGQLPLQQIGYVDVSEVNSVVHWLAGLTAEHRLPQKLLVIHQFRPSMIQGENELDTSEDDLSIVLHMDGQGSQGAKQATWNGVTSGAPSGVFFGWKNFFTKDDPMLTPQQTMTKTPTPVMISYQ
jgi:hypothetical protein